MEFTIEIREEWLLKKTFDTENRTTALAAAKAWYVEQYGGDEKKGIEETSEAKRVNVDFQLQWPDGRPLHSTD